MEMLDKVREIIAAEENGDYSLACKLYDQYPEVLKSRREAVSLLHGNAIEGRLEFVKALLERGVDVNATDPEEYTQNRAIVHAVQSGRMDLIQLLLERGSDVNWSIGGREPNCVPLGHAILSGKSEIAKLIIDAGAMLNSIDNCGKTPLEWAQDMALIDLVFCLRSKGALTAGEVRAQQGG